VCVSAAGVFASQESSGIVRWLLSPCDLELSITLLRLRFMVEIGFMLWTNSRFRDLLLVDT
jgi:hypothetical protein